MGQGNGLAIPIECSVYGTSDPEILIFERKMMFATLPCTFYNFLLLRHQEVLSNYLSWAKLLRLSHMSSELLCD